MKFEHTFKLRFRIQPKSCGSILHPPCHRYYSLVTPYTLISSDTNSNQRNELTCHVSYLKKVKSEKTTKCFKVNFGFYLCNWINTSNMMARTCQYPKEAALGCYYVGIQITQTDPAHVLARWYFVFFFLKAWLLLYSYVYVALVLLRTEQVLRYNLIYIETSFKHHFLSKEMHIRNTQ